MPEEKELRKEADKTAGSAEDEEIIELTDELEVVSQDDEEIIELLDEATPPAVSDSSERDSGVAPTAFRGGDVTISDEIDEELEFDEQEPDDFVNSLGMDLETDTGRPLDENDSASAVLSPGAAVDAVTPEQVEAAVERVMMKLLSEKIDAILSAAIERILTREIEKIRNILLDESSNESF